MAWCRQATSHYMSQCWPRSLRHNCTKPTLEPVVSCWSPGTNISEIWNKIPTNLSRNCMPKYRLQNVGQLAQASMSYIHSLRPGDAIWRHRSGSTLARVMACCLTAPSHYLKQCWLIISKVLWHSFESNFIRDTSATIHWSQLENYLPKIKLQSPRGQWVNAKQTHALKKENRISRIQENEDWHAGNITRTLNTHVWDHVCCN